ncbi:MAG TPA: hypothetical protein VHG72_14010 [Polyangia bacterium]|nr:hypothetical protein [Polyangia bacterium]
MKTPPPLDDAAEAEWAKAGPTALDPFPLAELAADEVTPQIDPTTLPGYELGLQHGKPRWRAVGYNEAITDLYAVLVESQGAPRHVVDQLADLMRQRARAVPER